MFPRARTPDGEIEGAGGAYVRRRLPFGDRVLVNGDRLTAEEVASIPDINLRSLVNLNVIELFPASPDLDKIEEEYKAKLAEAEEAHTAALAEIEERHKLALSELGQQHQAAVTVLQDALETAKQPTDVSELQAELEKLRSQAPPPASPGDCFLMPAETGKGFHIIQGRQVTDKPLSRAQATAKMKELTAP